MEDELFDDIYNELNEESPRDVLYETLEEDFDEVIVITKSDDEILTNFDYQDDLTALGMLKVAEKNILNLMEED